MWINKIISFKNDFSFSEELAKKLQDIEQSIAEQQQE